MWIRWIRNRIRNTAERIERFTEGQAFLHVEWSLPPSLVSKLERYMKTDIPDGRGGGGGRGRDWSRNIWPQESLANCHPYSIQSSVLNIKLLILKSWWWRLKLKTNKSFFRVILVAPQRTGTISCAKHSAKPEQPLKSLKAYRYFTPFHIRVRIKKIVY